MSGTIPCTEDRAGIRQKALYSQSFRSSEGVETMTKLRNEHMCGMAGDTCYGEKSRVGAQKGSSGETIVSEGSSHGTLFK